MYGLLLQAALEFISTKFSSDIAQQVLMDATGGAEQLDGRIGVGRVGFSIHQIHSDKLFFRLAQSAADTCGLGLEQIMEQIGHFFVRYIQKAGYESLLRVLGRNLSDFILGLDNLHEYFRVTYPKIKAPSFAVVQEDANGMTIIYRSTRGNLQGYVGGQLSEVARVFYGISVTVTAQPQRIDTRGKYSTLMRLDFDNRAYYNERHNRAIVELSPFNNIDENNASEIKATIKAAAAAHQLQITPEAMFDDVTFYTILNHDLEIVSVGHGIHFAMPNVIGRDVNEVFELVRPAIPCTWQNILDYSNNVFEIHSLQPVKMTMHNDSPNNSKRSSSSSYQESFTNERFLHLRLRGQMIHFPQWDCIIFFAIPMINSLRELNLLGLKIHDLSMMHSSRELITLRHHRDIGKVDALMAQEAKIGTRLDTLHEDANLYRQKRTALLEEVIPHFILKSTSSNLTATHASFEYSNKAAAIACYLSLTKAVTSPPIVKEVITTLNAVFRKFDNLTAKYSLCKILSFSNDYQLVVGIPFHVTLPANLAVLIAEDLIDAAEVSNDSGGLALLDLTKPDEIYNKNNVTTDHRRSRKTIINNIQIAIDIGPVIGTVIGVTLPRYMACGRPVTISQQTAHIAIPNTVMVTSSVVNEMKKNEFSKNYEYKSIVTIQMPLLTGQENIEFYTVSSLGRKFKREANNNNSSKRHETPCNNNLRTWSPGAGTTSSVSSVLDGNNKADEKEQEKIPGWMKHALGSGEVIPMANVLTSNKEDRQLNSRTDSSTMLAVNSNNVQHQTSPAVSITPNDLEKQVQKVEKRPGDGFDSDTNNSDEICQWKKCLVL